MKHYLPKNFVYLAAMFYVLMALQSLHAIKIEQRNEYPAGMIHMSLNDEKGSMSFRVAWGGDTDITGKNGPFVELRRYGAKTSETINLKPETVDKLFVVCSQLSSTYYVPRSAKDDANRAHAIQLYLGAGSDPVMLTFPANEPKLWNFAVEHWTKIVAIFKTDVSVDIPLLSPLKDDARPLPKGMSSLADFTTLSIQVTKVNRKKSEYGTITISWKRTEDGKITFDAEYLDRLTRTIKSKPAPKQIKPIFDEVQSLAKNYRYPSFAFNKNTPLGRDYDSIDVRYIPSTQSGFHKLPFISKDATQWNDAESLWNLAKELFPEDSRNIIVE